MADLKSALSAYVWKNDIKIFRSLVESEKGSTVFYGGAAYIEGDLLYLEVTFKDTAKHIECPFAVTVYDKDSVDMLTKYCDGTYRRSSVTEKAWASLKINDYIKIIREKLGISLYEFIGKVTRKRKEVKYGSLMKKYSERMKDIKPISIDEQRFLHTKIFEGAEHYIYTPAKKKGERTAGYCTRCGTYSYVNIRPKHKADVKCPICKKKAQAISRNMLTSLSEQRFGMLFDSTEENELVVRYVSVYRNINFKDVRHPHYYVREFVRRIIGKDGKTEDYIYDDFKRSGKVLWQKSTKKENYYNKIDYPSFPTGFPMWHGKGQIYTKGLTNLLKKIGWDYTAIPIMAKFYKQKCKDDYDINIMFRYILEERNLNYLEFVAKQGWLQLAFNLTYKNAPNRDGKNIPSLIDVNKDILLKLLPYRKDVGMYAFTLLKKVPSLSGNDLKEAIACELSPERVATALKFTSWRKMARYISSFPGEKPERILSTWTDYLEIVSEFEAVKRNSSILFPKDLKAEHDRYVVLEREKRDAEKDLARKSAIQKITSQYEENLSLWGFKQDEFLIIPPKEGYDIIKEGHEQHICVGSPNMHYIEDMAEKKKVILFLRQEAEPEKSFYTVEVEGNVVRQVKGFSNKAPTEEVVSFMKKYSEKKALKYEPSIY